MISDALIIVLFSASAGLGCLWLGFRIWDWLAKRRASRLERVDSVIDKTVSTVHAVVEERDQLRVLIDRERAAREQIFNKVESIVGERDRFAKLYQMSSAEHANAQDMMMREIDSLSRQFVKRQQRVKKATTLEEAQAVMRGGLSNNAVLKQVFAEYVGTHAPEHTQANPDPVSDSA